MQLLRDPAKALRVDLDKSNMAPRTNQSGVTALNSLCFRTGFTVSTEDVFFYNSLAKPISTATLRKFLFSRWGTSAAASRMAAEHHSAFSSQGMLPA